MLKTIIFSLLILTLPLKIFAQTQDVYAFSTVEQQQRFVSLTEKFRCLVCQNETLADSNASLAQDLREKIADLIRQGQTDQQIQNYLVERYGQFILFRPLFETKTYLLWAMPFVLLITAIMGLLFFLRRRVLSSNNAENLAVEKKQAQTSEYSEQRNKQL